MKPNPLTRLGVATHSLSQRLRADTSGNILMMMGFAILPLTFMVGMGIDYSRAEKLQTKMNAAADSAALAAVSQSMISQSDAAAQAAARSMFNSQVAGLNGMIYNSSTDLHMTYVAAGAFNNGRTVTVTYTARSTNIFGSLLGSASLPITGTATANAAQAPYINFYLVMDTSPSMLLPSTSAGLNAIIAATQTSHLAGGCAFACHNQNPHDDNIYVHNSSGQDIWLDKNGAAHAVQLLFNNGDICTASCGTNTSVKPKNAVIAGNTGDTNSQYADGVWLTQNYDTLYPGGGTIDLRVNDETLAARDLIPFATQQAIDNKVSYKLQMFGFGYGAPTALTPSMVNVNTLSTASVPNLLALQTLWYKNGMITATNNINDQATDFTTMMNSMNTTMPNPGTGVTAATPQEVMFLITDGMDDENLAGSRNHRELRASHIAQCTAIKNRGIKIAVLYTEYLPGTLNDTWSQNNVAPYLANVQPALVQCASTARDGTPLVYTVTTDQNISTALAALFSLTVQAAALIR
jgi:Flp pilus assembly protein TadG